MARKGKGWRRKAKERSRRDGKILDEKVRAAASSPVRISYLPGFEPPAPPEPAAAKSEPPRPTPRTKLPFTATITGASGRSYEVEVAEIGLRFVRWIT